MYCSSSEQSLNSAQANLASQEWDAQPVTHLDVLICIKVDACSRKTSQSNVTLESSGQPGADQQAGIEV